MSPGGGTSTEAGNDKGDFVFVIVEKHRRFVVKVELAVIEERCVFRYFAVELGGWIDLGFSEGGRCERFRRFWRFRSGDR